MATNYRINVSWEGLKSDSNPLITSPHPAYFVEGEIIGESESGYPIELGEASARWVYEDQILSALAWDQLIDFIDDSGFGTVYIQTRNNEITAGRFTYSRYKGFMRRPEGTPFPPWRYKEVEIEFFSLTAWSDAEEAGA